MKKEQDKEKKKKKESFFWLMSVSFVAVGLLLFCQFFFGDAISDDTTFYANTFINGVDVSGLTKAQAKEAVQSKMLSEKDDISLTLKSGDKSWNLSGSDFEVKDNLESPIAEVLSYGREGNIFQKKQIENKIKKEGLSVNISYANILGGVESRIEEITSEIEKSAVSAQIVFSPDQEKMFTLSDQKSGLVVERDMLYAMINESLENGKTDLIEVPVREIFPQEDMSKMLEQIKLISSFSTSYSTSTDARKSNVRKALDAFNGMVVEQGQEVSFNKTTGPRTVANGYKNANIIVGGSYVKGAGGGVCQASTTLYNALILADVEILQCTHHSLPASYVPLSFDAMVSEGYADLVFKNNLAGTIYIKTHYDENNVYVEIYGPEREDGLTLRTRSELVKVLGHEGDKIIKDTKGEYASQVLYKGEYYRLKYPREGYESKGYVQYLKDGQVQEEKMIRHDHYLPQVGVIVEGTEELGEGMTLPASTVKYIPPQKVSKESEESVRQKLEKTFPSAYNP